LIVKDNIQLSKIELAETIPATTVVDKTASIAQEMPVASSVEIKPPAVLDNPAAENVKTAENQVAIPIPTTLVSETETPPPVKELTVVDSPAVETAENATPQPVKAVPEISSQIPVTKELTVVDNPVTEKIEKN